MPRKRADLSITIKGKGGEVTIPAKRTGPGKWSASGTIMVLPPGEATAATAAVTGVPAWLLAAALGPDEPPAVTLRLQRAGQRTKALETNVARAPVFTASRRGAVQMALEWEDAGPVYGRSFMVRGQPLTVRDAVFLTDVMTEYIRAGCPEHRRVAFSLGQIARRQGARSVGGRQRLLAKESLRRLRGVSFESTVRAGGHEEAMGWGLIDWWRTTDRGGGRGSLALSEPLAALLRAGSVTFLDGPTLDALADRDEVAARLWMFLESEHLPRPWHYNLYAAPPGQPARERNMPALTDLLRLTDTNRARGQARVARAAAAVHAVDPAYELRVVKSREPGMWRLDVTLDPARRIPQVPYPESEPDRALGVQEVGHKAYEGRALGVQDRDQKGPYRRRYRRETTVVKSKSSERPDYAAVHERGLRLSAKRRAMLDEITARQGAEWTADWITHYAGPDADLFGDLGGAESALRRARVSDADSQEAEWEKAKAAERQAAADSPLAAELAGVLGSPARPGPVPAPDDEDRAEPVPHHKGQHPDCAVCAVIRGESAPALPLGIIRDPATGEYRARTPDDQH